MRRIVLPGGGTPAWAGAGFGSAGPAWGALAAGIAALPAGEGRTKGASHGLGGSRLDRETEPVTSCYHDAGRHVTAVQG